MKLPNGGHAQQINTTAYDLLQLGLSPAACAILGSNKPFHEWDVHEADVIAVISAKVVTNMDDFSLSSTPTHSHRISNRLIMRSVMRNVCIAVSML